MPSLAYGIHRFLCDTPKFKEIDMTPLIRSRVFIDKEPRSTSASSPWIPEKGAVIWMRRNLDAGTHAFVNRADVDIQLLIRAIGGEILCL